MFLDLEMKIDFMEENQNKRETETRQQKIITTNSLIIRCPFPNFKWIFHLSLIIHFFFVFEYDIMQLALQIADFH